MPTTAANIRLSGHAYSIEIHAPERHLNNALTGRLHRIRLSSIVNHLHFLRIAPERGGP